MEYLKNSTCMRPFSSFGPSTKCKEKMYWVVVSERSKKVLHAVAVKNLKGNNDALVCCCIENHVIGGDLKAHSSS